MATYTFAYPVAFAERDESQREEPTILIIIIPLLSAINNKL